MRKTMIEPEVLDITELKRAVGRYVLVWRKERKCVARLLSLEKDSELVYEVTSGPDKGKRFQAKFFAKTIKVYDEDNLALASLE